MAVLQQERVTQQRGSQGKKSFWRSLNPYFFLLPAFLVMGVITYYPVLYQVWMSFTDYGLKNLRYNAPWPDFVGLTNYINILTNQLGVSYYDFLRILSFSLFCTFSNVIIHVALGILIA